MAIQLFDLITGLRLRKKNVHFQYSTEEQFTGEYWVDGKKIYCKTITGSSGGKTSVLINHGVANIGSYRAFDYSNSYFYNATSRYMIGNYVNPNAFASPFQINPTAVEIIFGAVWAANWNLILTIRYTKN